MEGSISGSNSQNLTVTGLGWPHHRRLYKGRGNTVRSRQILTLLIMAGFLIPKWLALEEMKASARVFTMLTFNPLKDQCQKSAEDNTGAWRCWRRWEYCRLLRRPVGLHGPRRQWRRRKGEVPGRVDGVGKVAQSEAGR